MINKTGLGIACALSAAALYGLVPNFVRSAYLNGTSTVDVTPRWLSPAVAKSLKDGSVRDVIVELVQTDAFLTVSR